MIKKEKKLHKQKREYREEIWEKSRFDVSNIVAKPNLDGGRGPQKDLIESEHLHERASSRFGRNDTTKSIESNERSRSLKDQKQVDNDNRMFWRNPDDTKLYTQRFVRKLKANHKKVVEKFVLGTIYALKVQKKMTMMRARAFVRGTYNQVEETFKMEALLLLEQNEKLKSDFAIK